MERSASGLERRRAQRRAKWFIPTESEWYKAAYYDPVAGHYWNFATGTNTMPTSAPPGGTPNTANFRDNTTGFAVTGSRLPPWSKLFDRRRCVHGITQPLRHVRPVRRRVPVE